MSSLGFTVHLLINNSAVYDGERCDNLFQTAKL